MAQHKLTDIAVRMLKPKSSSFQVSDGGGLYLKIYPNGSKSWLLRKYSDGKQTNIIANGGLASENLQVGTSLHVDKPVVIRNLHNKVDCGTLLKAGQRLCETADVRATTLRNR